MGSTINYNTVLDYFFHLDIEEKKEMLRLMEKNIAEEYRNEIYLHFQATKEQEAQQKLSFASDIDTLKKML
ncbi:MAG: hypothetical protein ACRC0A_05790 [Chitinophagaceae bacterium]